ncbi:MAG: serine hydrolase domain-containing protein [Gemmatimonadaceae bacterium]
MQGACALLLLFDTATATAQSRAEKRSRAALARELHDSIGRVLKAAVQDRAFPGAYVLVGDSRGILAEHGDGHLDWTKSPRPDRHTLWDLASLTKIVGTTTALAQLVERGAVDLDSPVQRYVPDWTGPGKESVTVRHLLTHTSGSPSFKAYDEQTHNADSLAMLLFTTPLEQAPGAKMTYSDIGAFMMGVVAERVSGKRLDAYLDENLFRPLKMRETRFNPPRSTWKRVAPTEIDERRGGLVRGKVHDERAYYLGGVATHAGLFGSAHDLSRFATMLLRNGALDGRRVLEAATIVRFTAYADSTFSNRALGWQKPERPDMRYRTSSAWAGRFMSSRAFGHTGFTGTSIAVDPELDLYIILLSNRVNPTRNNPKISEVRARLADAVVSAVRHKRGPTLNAELP